MALYKEITNSKGIKTRYYRISKVSVNVDENNIEVTTKEYVDDTYRNIEKDISNRLEDINTLQEKIDSLNEDYEKNEQEIVIDNENLSEKIEQFNNINNQDYYIDEKTYTFDYEDKEYSMTILYDMLKQLEEFKDAEDC